MATFRSLFQTLGSRPQPSSKALPAPQDKLEVPAAVDGAPNYRYEFKAASVGANPEGDRFQIMQFDVWRDKTRIGVMSVWHNRNGAFAHYLDLEGV